MIRVIMAYLTVIGNEDILNSLLNRAEVSKQQLDRLDVLNKQGAIKPSEFSDLKGQLMNDQLAIVNARSVLESSKLSLAQLMNKNYDKNMRLQRIDMSEFLANYAGSADDVYENATK